MIENEPEFEIVEIILEYDNIYYKSIVKRISSGERFISFFLIRCDDLIEREYYGLIPYCDSMRQSTIGIYEWIKRSSEVIIITIDLVTSEFINSADVLEFKFRDVFVNFEDFPIMEFFQ
jgi:hypothetical protein